MQKKGLNEIRKLFLEFFESKGHLVEKSYPLVPLNDKSLLLINSGMAPLKAYFAGTEVPPRKRMATCQKCIRTGDIENVGRTARHATFFEMLGNFSFGDYFKVESLQWGWEFVTKHLEMPVDKVWATIYEEDNEAYDIWIEKIGLPKERIVRLGKKDNFWEIGLGPCGPCSELYFDRGESYGCDDPDCKPGCDCDRYVEFWNHVFTQFDRDEEGNYNPLPNPNIDTGAGLERLACIMQGVDSIFEIDTMKHIVETVCTSLNQKYNENDQHDVSIRIITDHIRSITFMISDGILPSNEGRGYVLRRLLRRAARHGILLGKSDIFLYEIMDSVVDMYGGTYTELNEKRDFIKKIIKVEEERFQETIHTGLEILNGYIDDMENSNEMVLKGEHAFKLYDTYGFPIDLTKEILEEKGLDVDEVEFELEMEKQRDRARKARLGEDIEGWKEDIFASLNKDVKSEFVGYKDLNKSAKVLTIVRGNEIVTQAVAGDEIVVILEETPFYAESGGQVGDLGLLTNEFFSGIVKGTKKGPNNQIHHIVDIEEGTIEVGNIVECKVDKFSRYNTAKNHTATHLLHKTLKEVVGNHVQQAGSLVSPDKLRFDFNHFEGLTKEEVTEIEKVINEKILLNIDVEVFETSLKEAQDLGAEALFGEKYGENVRVVKIEDESIELCGGTHVKNISEIGIFVITSESGVASGVRRIEAITGIEAYNYLKEQQNTIKEVTELVKTNTNNLIPRIETLLNESKDKDKEIAKLKGQLSTGAADELLAKVEEINGVKTLVEKVDVSSMDDLRKLGDSLKDKLGSGVILLAMENEDKVNFVSVVTKDVIGKGIHAGNLVKEAASITGGGGGGRPDMAQAGGKNKEKIGEALKTIKETLKSKL